MRVHAVPESAVRSAPFLLYTDRGAVNARFPAPTRPRLWTPKGAYENSHSRLQTLGMQLGLTRRSRNCARALGTLADFQLPQAPAT